PCASERLQLSSRDGPRVDARPWPGRTAVRASAAEAHHLSAPTCLSTPSGKAPVSNAGNAVRFRRETPAGRTSRVIYWKRPAVNRLRFDSAVPVHPFARAVFGEPEHLGYPPTRMPGLEAWRGARLRIRPAAVLFAGWVAVWDQPGLQNRAARFD